MSTIEKEYICAACHHRFYFQPEGEGQQQAECPSCHKLVWDKRGSGRDQGQSHLHYGVCPKCNSQTELFPIEDGTYSALCPECANAYSSSSY